jgi:hypothetical protein
VGLGPYTVSDLGAADHARLSYAAFATFGEIRFKRLWYTTAMLPELRTTIASTAPFCHNILNPVTVRYSRRYQRVLIVVDAGLVHHYSHEGSSTTADTKLVFQDLTQSTILRF